MKISYRYACVTGIYIINLSDGVNVVNYLRLQLFVFAPTSKQLMYTINIQIITRLIAAAF